ncbi:MAG TPA: hemerythrin domain-containing protein [Gammaproteobacteria bacterium]|nr:hemerythrin domain-containing protein [Gammaproteobacteria bacterium]
MLEKLFRKQPPNTEPPKGQQTQARPEVVYDPGLIAALTQQHRDLTVLLVKASSASQQGLYEEVREALAQFRAGLVEHLKRESAQLHPYLTAHLKGEDSRELLKDMRSNYVRVEQSVEGFLNHYSGYPVSDVNADRFEMEIEGVSEEFCEEIEKEEASFYTLYLPPESY